MVLNQDLTDFFPESFLGFAIVQRLFEGRIALGDLIYQECQKSQQHKVGSPGIFPHGHKSVPDGSLGF